MILAIIGVGLLLWGILIPPKNPRIALALKAIGIVLIVLGLFLFFFVDGAVILV